MKKLVIQENLAQVHYGVLRGTLKSLLEKKTLELNSNDIPKSDPSNPSESKVDPLDTLSAGQRAALEILKNKNLIVSQKEADKALRKHKRDTVNMGCLKCPLTDVNGAAPQYTLERLHTKRHARKSDDEHIIMIVYSAPANDQDFVAKAANKIFFIFCVF